MTAALLEDLPDDEVHVWLARTDGPPDEHERWWSILAVDELERAVRFRREHDRDRFVAAHGLLRTILARYAQQQPDALIFQRGAYGKPALAGGTGLQFSLSHAGDIVAVAVARSRAVGIDVERIRRDLPYRQMAARFFAPDEIAMLQRLPADVQIAAFFACWTRKEAYVKATGEGMARPLSRFSVSLAPDAPAALLADHDRPGAAERWTLCALDPGAGYAGALAVEGSGPTLRVRGWPE